MRMLDNVIDINYYAVKKARDSNLRHRPVGLGIMGFQDCLYHLRAPYASPRRWSLPTAAHGGGLLLRLLGIHGVGRKSVAATAATGAPVGPRHPAHRFDWTCWPNSVAAMWRSIAQQHGLDRCASASAPHGMRNSNCVAIAPTATISNIIGVDASIEPCFGNLSVKSNLSGEFTVINDYLVRDLKRLGLWDDVMVMDLKHFDGSLRRIDRVPEELKRCTQPPLKSSPSGWWRRQHVARSGSTRRSRSTSTWRARRARSWMRPTSWRGCVA
jgi:ribonucleoside-diphosphate reductase alpha chain